VCEREREREVGGERKNEGEDILTRS